MARKVLFISVDQMRADYAGFAGHPMIQTPHLDALAAEGTVFENHFCNTTPCGPARATMLTGLYPMTHRSINNGTPLDARFTNIALEASELDFSPVLFGYTDSSVDPRTVAPDDPRLLTYEGVLPGFTQHTNLNLEGLDQWLSWLNEHGYDTPDRPLDIYNQTSHAPDGAFPMTPATYKAEHSDTAFLAGQAMSYMEANASDDWFVHLVFLRPHPPLIAPAPYNTLYNWQDLAGPAPVETDVHPFIQLWRLVVSDPDYFMSGVSMAGLSDEGIKQARAIYMGLISEVDHHIGQVIECLKRTGQWDDTLIVFTSDHGEELGDHGLWGKGGFYDGSYHVPLIVRDPKADGGSRVTAFTEHVDLAPTILNWLGKDAPHVWDGHSLLPWVSGKTPEAWRNGVFLEFDWRFILPASPPQSGQLAQEQHQLCVWRDANHKLVHFADGSQALFDLTTDPGERTNLAADPAYDSVRADYLATLMSHRMTHADRTLTHIRLSAH